VLLLFPILGVLGAALAFGLARVAAGMWATGSGYRLLGLRWPWRFSLRVVLASAIMAALVAVLNAFLPFPDITAHGLARLVALPLLLAIASVGGAVFLLALRLLGGIDPQDRRQLEHMKLPLKRYLLQIL
jgi:peptidoglycan biosynthesis protein MviN/MurJ (putative lipid II flippase)